MTRQSFPFALLASQFRFLRSICAYSASAAHFGLSLLLCWSLRFSLVASLGSLRLSLVAVLVASLVLSLRLSLLLRLSLRFSLVAFLGSSLLVPIRLRQMPVKCPRFEELFQLL